MKEYRVKDPIIVEAVQFDPATKRPDCVYPWPKEKYQPRNKSWGYIETVGGMAHILYAGDWIVKDVTGHFSVCKPDIFEETYEAVLRDEEGKE